MGVVCDTPSVPPEDRAELWVSGSSELMPMVTTGNTNAPSIMIGERAAEFLLADA